MSYEMQAEDFRRIAENVLEVARSPVPDEQGEDCEHDQLARSEVLELRARYHSFYADALEAGVPRNHRSFVYAQEMYTKHSGSDKEIQGLEDACLALEMAKDAYE